MSTLTDAIAAQLADGTLIRRVPVPTGDLGYGTDLDCADDLTATMGEVFGDSPRAVAQANYRRLRTQRGTLPDDPDYGWDLRAALNTGATWRGIEAIAGQIRVELLKDDRNDPENLSVRLIPLSPTNYRIEIRGTCAQGPYSLTMALNGADLLLQEIKANGATV